MTGRLGVAEGQPVPHRSRLVVGQVEQLGHRVALHVRRAEQVVDRELPAGEIALEREVGDAHRRASSPTASRAARAGMLRRVTERTIVIAGSPTALGGHFGGHGARARRCCATLGLRDRLAARPGPRRHDLARPWRCRQRSGLGRRSRPAREEPRPDRRLSRSARDATSQTGLVQGGRRRDAARARRRLHDSRRARWPASAALDPGIRLGLAWFDAHGDFNTPDTTPSGNVWGMPFAMACGRGDATLVAAAEGPSVRELDAGLFGGQVLDETESRMLAASGVAQFGPGMLARPRRSGGRRGLGGRVSAPRSTPGTSRSTWTRSTRPGRWAIAMPEPDGLSLETAVATVRAIATSGAPVIGFGATAVMERDGADLHGTVDAIAALTEAALAERYGRDLLSRGGRSRRRNRGTSASSMPVADRQPARRLGATDDDRVAPVIERDQRPRLVAERRRRQRRCRPARSRPTSRRRPLLQRQRRAGRSLVRDRRAARRHDRCTCRSTRPSAPAGPGSTPASRYSLRLQRRTPVVVGAGAGLDGRLRRQ